MPNGTTLPAVPIAPGVPQVLRDIGLPVTSGYAAAVSAMLATGASPTAIREEFQLLTGDTFVLHGPTYKRFGDWGIYQSDVYQVALACDSVISFDMKREWAVADYPVEGPADKSFAAGFETYDKVATPYETRVQVTKMGSEADRSAFLRQLDVMAGDLKLYRVVTPDIIYLNANIVRYDYRRTATNGLSMIIANIVLREIRVATPASFSPVAAPSGAAMANTGIWQMNLLNQISAQLAAQLAAAIAQTPNAIPVNPLAPSIAPSTAFPVAGGGIG